MNEKDVKIDAVSVNDDTPSPDTENKSESTADTQIAPDAQIEKLSAQLTELTDKYLRLVLKNFCR